MSESISQLVKSSIRPQQISTSKESDENNKVSTTKQLNIDHQE